MHIESFEEDMGKVASRLGVHYDKGDLGRDKSDHPTKHETYLSEVGRSRLTESLRAEYAALAKLELMVR